MKIIDAITRIDALKYNTYSREEKLEWLTNLDAKVKKLIIDTHQGGERVEFTGYDEKTDPETELLIPAPFDEVYLRWMEAQIDYYNGEFDKYNNAIIMFNAAYEAFEKYYNQNNMPLSHGSRFKF